MLMSPPASRGRLAGAMEVQSILRSGASTDEAVSLSPQKPPITTSPTETLSQSDGLSFPPQDTLHRSSSTASSARKSKRLSMTIPIQRGSSYTSTRTTPSPTKSAAPTSIPEDLASPTGPTDSNFLTALAAQERRVLELKEELIKAEQVLRKLKYDWATHEAQKKRHDAKRVQKLRPLSSGSLPGTNTKDLDANGVSASQTLEMERRKALVNGTKTSNRTVFSGSKHARALSLLSPTSLIPRTNSLEDVVPQSAHSERPTTRPPYVSRASTNADLTKEVMENTDHDIDLGLPREVLLNTGRKMASDFKDGLWTFLEDLRQATVGEEGVSGTQGRNHQRSEAVNGHRGPRNVPSKASIKGSNRPHATKRQSAGSVATSRPTSRSPARREDNSDLIDVGGSFWIEHGLGELQKAKPHSVRKSPKKSTAPGKSDRESLEAGESWDNWDSPVVDLKQSRSSSGASVSDGTTPRTSLRYAANPV